MKYLAGVVLTLIATPAFAAPVYLTCELPGGSEPDSKVFRWELTLNEEGGTVSYTISTGARVQNEPALFTAKEVSWGRESTNALIKGGGISISRVDLTITRYPTQIGDHPPTGGATGKCSVVTNQKRAF